MQAITPEQLFYCLRKPWTLEIFNKYVMLLYGMEIAI